MDGPYEVIWKTDDGIVHTSVFPCEDHSLRKACDYCYGLKKRSDVVKGFVYAINGTHCFASFDKEEDL